MRRAGEFLDEPSVGFARFVWFYPLNSIWLLYLLLLTVCVCPPLAAFISDNGWEPVYLYYYWTPLVVLLFSSRWFRSRVAFMLFAWFLSLILLNLLLGMTQGAYVSAISKAFSAAVVQGTK